MDGGGECVVEPGWRADERIRASRLTIGTIMKVSGVIVIVITMGICALVLNQTLMVNRVGPASVTVRRMDTLKEHILQFAVTNNRLPINLTELTIALPEKELLRDGWKNEFEYRVENDGAFQLTSRAKNEAVGRNGPHTDIICRIVARDAGGNWKPRDATWDYESHFSVWTNTTAP
jgi:hypothetical protein